jgi:hypothetical protein
MADEDPKRGTKINPRNGANVNPVRGVTKKEAARTLKANAAGKRTDTAKTKASKRAAADHYGEEARKAGNSKPWWSGKK